MSDIAIIAAIIAAMVVLFVSNRLPNAAVALCGALLLYATAILDLPEALAGFGDTTVLFIACLFVVSAGLNGSGVTAWVGQRLVARAGRSRRRLLGLAMLMVAVMAAMIGTSGAVAALLPVLVLAAIRLGHPAAPLLMPLAFAANAGSMLVLTGSLVNVVISDALVDQGEPPLGFLELSLVGLTLLGGTLAFVLAFGDRLLPTRAGRGMPEDLSRHSGTLSEQYQLFEDVYQLVVTETSPYLGRRREALQRFLERRNSPQLSLIAIRSDIAIRPDIITLGDTLVLRGEAKAVAEFAKAQGLDESAGGDARQKLFNSHFGFIEVVLPPRSGLIGEPVFPGMVTQSGDLIILGIQRQGETLGPGEVILGPGDTLLLQGQWDALEEHAQDPDVLVVTKPGDLRSQAIPLGRGSRRAIAILVLMVLLLASGAVPAVVAGLVAACAVVLLGVLPIERAYRAVNWNVLIMVASLIPLSTAMYKTGAAALMADALVGLVGQGSPYALLALLFAITAIMGQLISSTATALIIIPVAIAAASAIAVSPRTALVTVAVAASAAYLTPIATSANLMVQGPGGYRFGDYWRLGLPLMGFSALVGILLVPLLWPF